MLKVTMEYARKHFGTVIHAAMSQPVLVCKANRSHVVFVSAEEYSDLVFLNNLQFLVQGQEDGNTDETVNCAETDRTLIAQVQTFSESSSASVADIVRKAISVAIEEHSLHTEKRAVEQHSLCWSLEDLIKCKDMSRHEL